jgi:hypothetical protein
MDNSKPHNDNSHEPKRNLGALRGLVKYIAPDFDAPLGDFFDHEPATAEQQPPPPSQSLCKPAS